MIDIRLLAQKVKEESAELIVAYGEELLYCLVDIKLQYWLDIKSRCCPTSSAYRPQLKKLLDLHEKSVLGWTKADDAVIETLAEKLLEEFPEHPKRHRIPTLRIDTEIREAIKKLKANAVGPSK